MIFEKLGIFGVPKADEKAILTGLFLGDPVLLIGPHGSAKTDLGKSIASALQEYSKTKYPLNEVKAAKIEDSGLLPSEWFQCAIYDCSKMQFEEIIGFPNPSTFEKGYVSYVESPVTVWGKEMVILDEFNRQSARQQNSLFELIRSRTIYGQETGTKIIFACMNPFGMEGTEVLDEALVDRMSLFVYTQGFDKLDDEVKESIICKIGSNDSPGLTKWTDFASEQKTSYDTINKVLAETGKNITDVLTKAGEIFFQLEKESGPCYALFINRFINTLIKDSEGEIEISSRRAAMMYRALLGYRAVELALHDILKEDISDLKESFINILTRTIPTGISESKGSVNKDIEYRIATSVGNLSSFFSNSDYVQLKTSLDVIGELLTSNNIVRKTRLILEYGQSENNLSYAIWNKITDLHNIHSTDYLSSKVNIQTAIVSFIIGSIHFECEDFLPENISEKVIKEIPSLKILLKRASSFVSFVLKNVELSTKVEKDINNYSNPLEKVYATLLWKEILDNQSDDSNFHINEKDIMDQVAELRLLLNQFKNLKKQKEITVLQ